MKNVGLMFGVFNIWTELNNNNLTRTKNHYHTCRNAQYINSTYYTLEMKAIKMHNQLTNIAEVLLLHYYIIELYQGWPTGRS